MNRETWLPIRPESAPAARAIVREAAAEQGLDDNATWDLMLATTEAVTNALLHGAACAENGGGILLRVEPRDHGLFVEVCDCGVFDAELRPARDDEPRGRGLPIIEAVVDQFELVPTTGRTRVRFGKRGALEVA